jgi:hypothetical protein
MKFTMIMKTIKEIFPFGKPAGSGTLPMGLNHRKAGYEALK